MKIYFIFKSCVKQPHEPKIEHHWKLHKTTVEMAQWVNGISVTGSL
jgi:hypothetical protein